MESDPREWTAYRLANEAECTGPDSATSAGAKMLESVRDSVVDGWEYTYASNEKESVDDDQASEIVTEAADGGPDVYTHQMWSEFVDLCAYKEDPTELGFDGSDMDQGARYCLYIIAERCARAVMDALRNTEDEDG